jgi:hypothetical protein
MTVMKKEAETSTGNLQIGDAWNAIRIIALSQSNPMKAIAEFVENSIDAQAKNITIIRGKQQGSQYLKIVDDGEGIDDFVYVATHIADSIKQQLKKSGMKGIQGEFGIGLLSFWTVGEELYLTSTGKTGKTRQMKLVKNNPGYHIEESQYLFKHTGTELLVTPILPGIRTISGEKIQNYLASELRDRISKSGVLIKIIDKSLRKELIVEPRKYTGRLLHNFPETRNPLGEIYVELYLNEPDPQHKVSLYKSGTRVIDDITKIERFNRLPWKSDYLEGIIDVPFLQLTPGTREGILYDSSFESFTVSLEPVEQKLTEIIEEQKAAEEEKASRSILKKVTRAIREAFLMLPQDAYYWLPISQKKPVKAKEPDGKPSGTDLKEGAELKEEAVVDSILSKETGGTGEQTERQKEIFEIPGPLHSAVISPSSTTIQVGEKKKLKIIGRDRRKRVIDTDLNVLWKIRDGEGSLDKSEGLFVEYTAPHEPGVTMIRAIVSQKEKEITVESIITIVQELLPGREGDFPSSNKGLPGYTYLKAPGQLWRSRFDMDRHLIIINNGHADFIYASRNNTRKLRYIARLFAKELVLANFPEANKEEILERMIELTLYLEDHLR